MFINAVESLDSEDRVLLNEKIDQWRKNSCASFRRIASNIDTETALGVDAFVALLQDFCAELQTAPADSISAWETACRRHKFKGEPVPPPAPTRLGRALPVGRYAKFLAPKAGLSDAKAEAMIRKVALAGASPRRREVRLLRSAPVGKFLIWATFHEDEPNHNPFEQLPHRTEAVRTALGLGECPETETLVLISWRREGLLATLSIHRPTVADAEAYSWYRPVADASAKCGYTAPLAPNLYNLPACPEVVHEEITGETLVFPVYLTT